MQFVSIGFYRPDRDDHFPGEIFVGPPHFFYTDPFRYPVYSASAWLTGKPDKSQCNFEQIPIGDYTLPFSTSNGWELKSQTTTVSGPIRFEISSKKDCCCETIECYQYYVHAVVVQGIGIEFEADVSGSDIVITSGAVNAVHHVYFNLAICADGTASAETVFEKLKIGKDLGFYVGHDLDANGSTLHRADYLKYDKTSAYHIQHTGNCTLPKEWLVDPVEPKGKKIPYRRIDNSKTQNQKYPTW